MDNGSTAIEAEGVYKDYKIYRSNRDLLLEHLTRRRLHQLFPALKNIDLSVRRGRVMGIMGPNGAGKSTLLKIITGTLAPTRGRVRVNGKVSAILELGTGFTPHDTGRENIAMGCLCLGMGPEEIRRKTDEIIAFSELEAFIDRPFHTYSTGMQARLTFSVAISPDPDVLIVDEALAVGDARFQQKCFGRIRAMREAGTTILLVSHDHNTISTFCDDAIIIMNGEKVAEGSSREMVVAYQKLMFGSGGRPSTGRPPSATTERHDQSEIAAWPITGEGEADELRPVRQEVSIGVSREPDVPAPRQSEDKAGLHYGNGRGELFDFGILDEHGRRLSQIRSGSRCRLFFRFKSIDDIDRYTLGFAIRDRRATVVYGVTTTTQNKPPPALSFGDTIDCFADVTMWLAEGDYALTMGAAETTDGEKIAFVDEGYPFKVVGPSGIFTTSIVNLETEFHLEHVRNKDPMIRVS